MRLREQKAMIAKRLVGHLPIINIYGQPFFIDIRVQQLRSVADYGKYLPFYLMQPDPMTHGRRFLYDPKGRALYHPLDSNVDVPDTLVLVHLPLDLQMDPIGVARMNGYDMDLALKMYPVQKELKAIVTELDTETTFYFIQLFMSNVGMSSFADAQNYFQEEYKTRKMPCCKQCRRTL